MCCGFVGMGVLQQPQFESNTFKELSIYLTFVFIFAFGISLAPIVGSMNRKFLPEKRGQFSCYYKLVVLLLNSVCYPDFDRTDKYFPFVLFLWVLSNSLAFSYVFLVA